MHCVFPTCEHDSSRASPLGISFHRFPDEPSIRLAWIKALRKPGWELEVGSVLCSKHFLAKDLVVTSNGHELRAGAVPLVNLQTNPNCDNSVTPCCVKICRICFATDCKMYSMTTFRILNKAYETLTGFATAEEDNLPQYLCTDCADRLMNCARFKTRSLRAHLSLLDIVKNHGYITLELVQSVMGIHSPLSSDPTSYLSTDRFDCQLNIGNLQEAHTLTDAQTNIKHEDVTVDDMKPEIDYVIDHGVIDREDIIYENDSTVYSLSLPDVNEVKTENDNLYNQDNRNVYSSTLNDNIDVDGITEENYMINQDNLSECSSSSYVDIVDDIIQVIPNEGIVCSASLYEDFVDGVFEAKINEVINQVEDTTDDGRHAFIFVGVDVLLGRPPLVQEARKKDKPTTQVEKVMKASTHFIEKKTNKHQTTEADRAISIDNTLSCDICSYRTDNVIQMLDHLKAHAAVKSYNCYMCNYKTVNKNRLQCHIRAHSGEKLYSCNVCKEIFGYRCTLNSHMRVHSGEKPYACEICKKKFSQKSNLKKHLKIHFKGNQYSCKIMFRKKCEI